MADTERITARKKQNDAGDYSPDMLLSEDTPFAVSEAYKTLRTNVLFSMAALDNESERAHGNAMIITSSIPGEGKSITSANLAIAFSQAGMRVLLIDADLRKPVQHKLFNISNEVGLSTALVRLDTLVSTIHHAIRPGLDMMTSGPIPPNPSELLGSQTMTKLLDIVCRVYDYIIFDTPPIDVVSDALTFGNDVSGILLAVRPDACRHADLRRALESISLSKTHVLGTVLSNTHAGGFGLPYRKKYGRYGSRYNRYNYYLHYDTGRTKKQSSDK